MNDAKLFWWISVERIKAKSEEEIRGNSYLFETGVRNTDGFFYLINLRLKLERDTDWLIHWRKSLGSTSRCLALSQTYTWTKGLHLKPLE